MRFWSFELDTIAGCAVLVLLAYYLLHNFLLVPLLGVVYGGGLIVAALVEILVFSISGFYSCIRTKGNIKISFSLYFLIFVYDHILFKAVHGLVSNLLTGISYRPSEDSVFLFLAFFAVKFLLTLTFFYIGFRLARGRAV